MDQKQTADKITALINAHSPAVIVNVSLCESDTVAHAFHISTREAEAERQVDLYELEVNLVYIVRPYLD